MYDALAVLVGYLLGSIPFGYLTARLYGIDDIRKHGSGNIGATNAWRVAGPSAGILVTVCDVGKGVLAVVVASRIGGDVLAVDYVKLIAGMAAIVGHLFPVSFLFRGGKGVNTALGVMLTLLPIQALIALGVFIMTVALSKYISLGSILGASAFFLGVLITRLTGLSEVHPVYVITTFILALLIIYAHRSNIKRLLAGNENRFNFSSKKHPKAESRV
ncbi:MAG: glycerol-3-phosphate 1-O-acyltransferase PlsY [candidate division Zixibacteria bacterium]|nr:glycerol-3-phosphate 1-O-acyltransferase PlsY [candidate division Zixibacteria bacterium]